jgi:hypothetical protein
MPAHPLPILQAVPLEVGAVSIYKLQLGPHWYALVEPCYQSQTGQVEDINTAEERALVALSRKWAYRPERRVVYLPWLDSNSVHVALPLASHPGCWTIPRQQFE